MSAHTISLPATRPPPACRARALVYFIPGNPGIVTYYSTFLHYLRASLDRLQHEIAFDIYGRSLAGFHDYDHAPFSETNPPYGLEEQILLSYADLAERKIPGTRTRKEGKYDFMVVIGHSVGSYIALEIFHRHMRDPEYAPHLRLYHGILLTPTVTHIARSTSGRRLTALSASALGGNMHRLAKTLLLPFPRPVLRSICRRVMGFTPEAARATADFLKSRDGVWQALHMARDEMRQISDDRWDEELWEVGRAAEDHRFRVPKFMFFFARNDHWVGDAEREEFVGRMRRHGERVGPEWKRGRVEVVVDEEGSVPHAFCTREMGNIFMADRVKTWLSQIQDSIVSSQGRIRQDEKMRLEEKILP